MRAISLVLVAANALLAHASLVNVNAVRSVDVTGAGIVRSKTSVRVRNDDTDPASEYLVNVPAAVADTVSFVAASVRADKGKSDLAVEKRTPTLYAVSLNPPLVAGESVVLDIATVYTQLVRPLPAVIDQGEEQLLFFSLNAYIHSQYTTEKQKTVVRLPSSSTVGTELKGPEPVSKKGALVTYGPYENIKPLQSEPFSLHYKDTKAILVVKSLSREMELSHWGSNLGVTEYYDLYNKGAALRDKLFSRIDYSMARFTRASSNVVEELRVTLPPKAANLYYRDDIGNVSTSHFRKSATRDSIMDIKPRYPLYGGWRYSWHHTYDVPLNEYLKKDVNTGRYTLQVKFMGSLSNVTIEKSRLRVVLPEGALNVQVALPFKADSQVIEKFYTNLDSIGRPMVIIEKANVADEYAVPIQISYDYPSSELLRKPIIVGSTMLGLLILGMAYARLDLSIVNDGKPNPNDVLQTERTKVTATLVVGRSVYDGVDESFNQFKTQGLDEAGLGVARQAASEKLDRVVVRLKKSADVVRGLGVAGDKELLAFVNGVGEIEALLKERLVKVVSYQDYVVAFLKEIKASPEGKVDDKKKEGLAAKTQVTTNALNEIDGKLSGIFERITV
ncbi:dolichyl-diphosphooligosaccharide---protein glycotransferase [Chytriomyces confervae]|uniref:Dolichyl-diphosphooligosaccharide--protein glycosyltransferase subunit 1 n=1 Tax=Chytriomyces confervae TaxID=246404 RepID=A0A507FFR0_9FUNG|nr:hypothetical protein HDU80_006418 [Chytriomyces hyalinus]TPX75063.1 dolichyl-diphosphooligosaccharide---protein glycotransferase [Chytriomyces confervae]